MKSPINWYGGKFYMIKSILPIIEHIEHKTFVEVFGGAGHLIFAKPPSKIDVYNDIHSGLVNFFKVLRTEPEALQKALQLTPYSREEYLSCKNWANVDDPIEQARQFYTALMQSFSNCFGTWSYCKTQSRRNMSGVVSRWLGNIDKNMPAIVECLRKIQIEHLDFEDCIKRYDAPNTLFYLDPPYLPEVRVAQNKYKHEMDYVDHERLIGVLSNIQGKAVLSGYDNELYNKLDWIKHSIGKYAVSAKCAAVGEKRTKREEMVWIKN